ncbi:hypothetical protein [Sinomonas sp. ASV322]|uniref:hypothetical protein n=1 Tax=Sinomonas sp. ASV322 TaxID=3041920 RepID=UPI0027DBC202|nr:hypothetical protein [Sinomonas sp. ASV322]MDQ4502377.1 hypothetical protein [Sinomonas sp. ASV322]
MNIGQQKQLVFQLRRKGVPESSLPGLLQSAREASAEQGSTFSVADFAAKVPKGRQRSKGTVLGLIAAAVVLAGLGGHLFLSGVVGLPLSLPTRLWSIAGTLLILIALVFAAHHVDRRLPEG